MVKIEIVRNLAGAITGFSVKGHTNTAPHGEDIVCAGVSALTQTAVLGLQEHLGRSCRLDIASGRLCLELCDAPDGLTGAILETMVLGLAEIAKMNSQSVHILEHRR
ncbi:MAG: ribosomal-processing cysteine protease Prp [Veillonellales bacterium]